MKIVRTGDWVIDAGANIGAFSIPLAKRVGKSGRLDAFEPSRRLFELLTANVALNDVGRQANVHQSALGDGVTRTARIPDYRVDKPGNFGGVSLVDRSYDQTQTYGVRVETVDDIVREVRDEWELRHGSKPQWPLCPQFLKLDVEGMEQHILRGGARILANCRPVIYSENNCRRDSPPLLQLLHKNDYKVAWELTRYFPGTRSFFPADESIFPEAMHAVNVIAFPREVITLPPPCASESRAQCTAQPRKSEKDAATTATKFSSTMASLFASRVRIRPGSYYIADYAAELAEKYDVPQEMIRQMQGDSDSACVR